MIVTGVIMIIGGLTTKQFYAATGIMGGAPTDKKMPRWAGRLLITGIGTVFLLVGIAHLCGFK